MNILFFDSLMPKGHDYINKRLVEAMVANGYRVTVASHNDYGLSENVDRIKGIEWVVPEDKPSLARMDSFRNFIKLIMYLRKNDKFDIVYIASYDICVFLPVSFLLHRWRKKVIIQEHNNLDHLANRWKRYMYRIFKNCFHHAVFEESFKDYLIQNGVKDEYVHVIPHACDDYPDYLLNNNRNVISLSGSNDPRIVEEVIMRQKEKGFLTPNSISLTIKSKTALDGVDNLTVLCGWITDDRMEELYKASTYVLLLFPQTYSYRVSAVFMDAVARHRYIIGTEFPLLKYYEGKYPSLCKSFRDIGDLPECFDFDRERYEEDRRRFIEEHSQMLIQKSFERCFKSIIR